MKILVSFIIILFFNTPAFSRENTIEQDTIARRLVERSCKFQTTESLLYIQSDSINKFNNEKLEKRYFTWKRKAAIRIIEQNLYTLNHLLKWEKDLTAIRANLMTLSQSELEFDPSVKSTLCDLIDEKKNLLTCIKEIAGLSTFGINKDYVYQFLDASMNFDDEFLQYFQILMKKTESNLIKNAEYERLKQQADNQLTSLETDIYKRMVKLNFDLEKFSKKKYSHVSKW